MVLRCPRGQPAEGRSGQVGPRTASEHERKWAGPRPLPTVPRRSEKAWACRRMTQARGPETRTTEGLAVEASARHQMSQPGAGWRHAFRNREPAVRVADGWGRGGLGI